MMADPFPRKNPPPMTNSDIQLIKARMLDWSRVVDVTNSLGKSYTRSGKSSNYVYNSTTNGAFCKGGTLLIDAAVYVVGEKQCPTILANYVIAGSALNPGDSDSYGCNAILTAIIKTGTTIYIGRQLNRGGIDSSKGAVYLVPTYSSVGKTGESNFFTLTGYKEFKVLGRSFGTETKLKSIFM